MCAQRVVPEEDCGIWGAQQGQQDRQGPLWPCCLLRACRSILAQDVGGPRRHGHAAASGGTIVRPRSGLSRPVACLLRRPPSSQGRLVPPRRSVSHPMMWQRAWAEIEVARDRKESVRVGVQNDSSRSWPRHWRDASPARAYLNLLLPEHSNQETMVRVCLPAAWLLQKD